MASEVAAAPWIWYFVSGSYKKRALSMIDYCIWYLSISLRLSISHTVGRTGLWQLPGTNGCPEKFTTMIGALYTGMMANVNVGGEVSESFGVRNGVKQGCVLAPTLFSIFLSTTLDEAFRDMGVASTYSIDRTLTYSTSHTSERRPRLLWY